MDHFQTHWGRPRDDVYGPLDEKIVHASMSLKDPVAHTQQPIITGTSVIGVKFNGGVILAADNLASYGSLARFTDQKRLLRVGPETVIGLGGDVSDMQYLQRLLTQLEIDENYDNTGFKLSTATVSKYLKKVMYNRRSKLDPLWNTILIAGTDNDGEPFLSYVDLLGVSYKSNAMASGYGAYLAVPLLRKSVDQEGDEKNLSEADARALIDKCMKVLFYRDARSLDKYSVATVRCGGEITIEDDVQCKDMSWRFAEDIKGYGGPQN